MSTAHWHWPRRSVAEWAVRIVLALALIVVAHQGLTRTTAYALRTTNIDRAHMLAPDDGRITALKAAALLQADPTLKSVGEIERLSRAALRQDPTAVTAASSLGLSAQIRGDKTTANRLLTYAQQLSRRDLQTQLWAIEQAVNREDVPGALKLYDITLRVSRRAPDLLFPILSSAISDPVVRAELAKRLATKPAWAGMFLEQLAGGAADQRATADLYMTLGRARVRISPGARAAVIDSLIASGAHDAAWAYYASFRPGVDRRRARDPEFAALLDTPTPFDWVPVTDAGISSSIQRVDNGGVLDFAVSAGAGGSLLRQRQVLPPGAYRLYGHSVDVGPSTDGELFWTLSCRDGEELGRVVVPSSDQAGGVFSGRFTVPHGCPVQMLSLVARASDSPKGTSGRIDRIQLQPGF